MTLSVYAVAEEYSQATNTAIFAAAGSNPAALTISDAVSKAVSWHPSIAEAAGYLQQQARHVDAAKSRYYPQINGGLRGGYDSGQQDNHYQQSAVLSVSQMLYDFGKISSSVRSEQAMLIRHQAGLLMAIDQLIQQTAQAALEMQRYQRLADIAAEQRAGIERLAGLVAERHNQGAGTRSDLVQSYSRIEAAKALQLQYQTQLDRWRSRLASQTGFAFIAVVDNDLSLLQQTACDDQVLEQNAVPAVLAAQAQRDQARAQLDQAKAQQRPSLTLDPSVRYYLDDPPYSGTVQEDRSRYEVHLNFNMPLYQGGGLRAQQHAARHALDSADAAMRNALLIARQHLQEAASQQRHLQYHQQVLLQREKLSIETRDLYRQQYLDLGNRSLLDLLNAEQDIHQTRMDKQNLLSDQYQLVINCSAASGKLRELFDLQQSVIQGVNIQP